MSTHYRHEDIYVRKFYKVVEYLNMDKTQKEMKMWDLVSVTPMPGLRRVGYHLLYRYKNNDSKN